MERLTKQSTTGTAYYVESIAISPNECGYSGAAIEQLAKFENLYDSLQANQKEISKKLEALRNEGKTKSVKFKELMVKKLTNSNTISMLNSIF